MTSRSSRTPNNALQPFRWRGTFEQHAFLAATSISKNRNTQSAYLYDLGAWLEFTRARGVDPFRPLRKHADLWVKEMEVGNVAPKTRARRIASMCSIYRELRRPDGDNEPGVVTFNPFSLDEGSRRERNVQPRRQTPIANPEDVRALLATCERGRPLDLRDRAIIRLIWATGARRSSVVEMTIDKLTPDRAGWVTDLLVKGNKPVRTLISRRASAALDEWIEFLKPTFTTGPIWRTKRDVLTGKGVWQMFVDRSITADLKKPISPHMLRVSFLTLNGASIEARQYAVGHANPATTQLYDRTDWKGREAFEKMPDVEDLL